jgi:hypothetical protein
MSYLLILLIFIIVIYLISNLINFKYIKDSFFLFFIKQLLILVLSISLFSCYITSFKTIYILFFPIYIFLFYKKYIIINKNYFPDLTRNLKYLLTLIPIILIQYFLYFDFKDWKVYEISNDIHMYGSIAYNLIQYKQENSFGFLNELYPKLFNGISAYHYFEIWITSMIGFITNKSYSIILILIVYPYLIWVLYLGIISIFENYNNKIKLKHLFFLLCLLFIGPIYFNFYETILNDGNVINSVVFTITGFTKQTLPFSFYGQKHLPVYVFCILNINLFLKYYVKIGFYLSLLITICSFGLFPGIYGGIGLMIATNKKIRTRYYLLIFLLTLLSLFYILSVNKPKIDVEISNQTIYINSFLTNLNLKGEIIRILAKFINPIIWLTTLYLPILIIFYIYRKLILKSVLIKQLLLFSCFSFISACGFISLLQGLNSDQFLTNLLPLFNCIIILIVIFIITKEVKKRNILFIFMVIITLNINSTLNHHQFFVRSSYSSIAVNTVREKLEKSGENPKIAYLLSGKNIKIFSPVMWYSIRPGKIFLLNNNYNFMNINYPYIKYPINSTSIAFSPVNQMRFYLKNKYVPLDKFGKIQLQFLQQNKIRWIFCSKECLIPIEIKRKIKHIYNDSINNELYIELK